MCWPLALHFSFVPILGLNNRPLCHSQTLDPQTSPLCPTHANNSPQFYSHANTWLFIFLTLPITGLIISHDSQVALSSSSHRVILTVVQPCSLYNNDLSRRQFYPSISVLGQPPMLIVRLDSSPLMRFSLNIYLLHRRYFLMQMIVLFCHNLLPLKSQFQFAQQYLRACTQALVIQCSILCDNSLHSYIHLLISHIVLLLTTPKTSISSHLL